MTVVYTSTVGKDKEGWHIKIPDSMCTSDCMLNLVEGQKVELEYVPKSKALIIRPV